MPSTSIAWNSWAARVVSVTGQRNDPGAFASVAGEVARIGEPLPDLIEWTARKRGGTRAKASQTPLAFLAAVGDSCFTPHGCDPVNEKVATELGHALIALGAPVGPDVAMSALFSLERRDLDPLGRLRMCASWGALGSMEPQRCLAYAARHVSWNTIDGAEAWDLLLAHGAAEGSPDWTGCPKSMQPAVCALLDRSWDYFKKCDAAGVSLDWRDPDSGATLWHFAAVGGAAMAKAILPLLSKRIPGMADEPARAADDFGIGVWDQPTKGSATPWAVGAGQSPLHRAAKDLEMPMVKALLGLKADPNRQDAAGDTPLHMLAKKHGAKAEAKAVDVVRALLAAGADPGIANAKGMTPAQAMAAKAPASALRELLALRPQDVGGEEPAQEAAFKKLASRGAAGNSLAEGAALRVAGSGALAADSAPRKPKSL